MIKTTINKISLKDSKAIKLDSKATDQVAKTENKAVQSAIPKDFIYIPTVFPPEPSRFDEVYSYFPHWDMSSYKGDKLK